MGTSGKQDSGQPTPGDLGAPPLPASHDGAGDEDVRKAKPETPQGDEDGQRRESLP